MKNSIQNYTNLQSKVYRGGKEEAPQAYSNIRRGADDAANKGRLMNANWFYNQGAYPCHYISIN